MNLSRRRFGSHVTGAAVGATMAACGAGASDVPASKRAIVLVHGSWFGAWSFARLTPFLTAAGFTVVAADLPGHGLGAKFPASFAQRPLDAAAFSSEGSPLASVTLNDYVGAVVRSVNDLSSAGFTSITVLGHSMAGIPITVAAEQLPATVSKLIYLSAFMPVTAVPAGGYLSLPQNQNSQIGPLLKADPTKVGALRFDTDSSDLAYRAALKSTFCADVSEDEFSAIAHLMQPDDPAQVFGTPTGATAGKWGLVPRVYIGCTSDNAVPPALQRLFTTEADSMTPQNKTDFRTFDASHTPFFSKPAELATLIASVAA